MKIYNYTVIFEQLKEGGYNVIVPAIPEICTHGETKEEARAMVEDALRCYLESAIKEKEQIPEDKTPSVEKIAIHI
jgi:antitoxin HicB